MTVECPDCGADHDVSACAREAAMCDCCSAIYASQDERAAACEASA